jgi:hypothetical protein
MTAHAELMKLIHGEVNPYAGFPLIWGGYYNTDGSERAIFRETMDRIKPRIIIEVGTFLGGSAMHMAAHAKAKGWDCAVLCVDTWLGGVDHWLRAPEKLTKHFGRPSLYYKFLNNVIEAGLTDYIVPFTLDSIAAARFLAEAKIMADMMYIDGSHESDDVLRDYSYYWPLLRSGGAFLVDDLTHHFPGVLWAWDKFLKMNNLSPTRIEGEKGLVIKP